MENMGRRVIKPGLLTMSGIDRQSHLVADLHPAFFDFRPMGRELWGGMVRVDDLDNIAAGSRDRAAVADLAAGFAVKRRLGGEELDLIALYGFASTCAVGVNG